MADTSAQRARRSRAHHAGDHSLCLAGRCPHVQQVDQLKPLDRQSDTPPRDAAAAERAKRYRRHRNGNHSLCLPGRCPGASGNAAAPVTLPVMGDVTQRQPSGADLLGLDEAGRELWEDVTALGAVGPLQAALLLEACRGVDRLNILDRQLKGGDWLRFRHSPEDEHEVVVYVDKVLIEAREQATTLKTIVAELSKTVGQSKAPPMKGGGVLADITARIAARSANPAG
jgi:hypothetical protein